MTELVFSANGCGSFRSLRELAQDAGRQQVASQPGMTEDVRAGSAVIGHFARDHFRHLHYVDHAREARVWLGAAR